MQNSKLPTALLWKKLLLNIQIFWKTTICLLVNCSWHFGRKFLPHLQNQCNAKDEAASAWVVTKKLNNVHYVKLAHTGSSAKRYLFIYLFIFIVCPVTHITPDSQEPLHTTYISSSITFINHTTQKRKKPKTLIHRIKKYIYMITWESHTHFNLNISIFFDKSIQILS